MLKTAKILFALCICLYCPEAICQNKFRTEMLQQTTFILPPKSKLELKDIKGKGTTVKDKYRYHFVGIEEPGSDFLLNVGKVDGAFYYYDKRENGKNKPTDFVPVPGCGALCAISRGWGMLIVRVDYQGIFKDPAPEKVTGAFRTIATALLKELSKRDGEKGWAAGTSQEVVKRVFDLVPVPQDSLLARYAIRITGDDSFILLSPEIFIRVDDVKRIRQGSDFHDQLVGSSVIRVSRDRDGKFIQQPFINTSGRVLPDNAMRDGKILQASSGDIQFSEALRDRPYVGLYTPTLKRNNNNTDPPPRCLISDDKVDENCNSISLHTKCLACLLSEETYESLLQSGQPDCKAAGCAEGDDIRKSALFGTRALMTPIFNIYINDSPVFVELNSTLQQIASSYRMPAKLKIFRLRHGKYYPFKRPSEVTLLMPGDKIAF